MFTAKNVRQKSIYIINRFLNYNAHAQKENRHIGKRYLISKERKINMANGGLETQRRHTLTALANYPTRLPKNTDNHTVRITKRHIGNHHEPKRSLVQISLSFKSEQFPREWPANIVSNTGRITPVDVDHKHI